MSFIQQKLATALWYYQSSSFTLAPEDEFKPMPCPHMKHSMCPTCPTCKLSHFSIRHLPRCFMDTCQEGWFNFKRQYMPLSWATCGLTYPSTLLAKRCVHHHFNRPTGSYLAATLNMRRYHMTTRHLCQSRYHMRVPRSHRYPRHVQHTPID